MSLNNKTPFLKKNQLGIRERHIEKFNLRNCQTSKKAIILASVNSLIMKNTFLIVFFFFTVMTNAQEKKESLKPQIVEASCGQCRFDMKEQGCDLAVRIDGKSYFVDGTSIDSHGDAHAIDGFCEAIRKAAVVGKIKNNRFIATSFILLPEENKEQK